MNTSTLRSHHTTLCVYGIAAGVAVGVIGNRSWYAPGAFPKHPR